MVVTDFLIIAGILWGVGMFFSLGLVVTIYPEQSSFDSVDIIFFVLLSWYAIGKMLGWHINTLEKMEIAHINENRETINEKETEP